MQIHELNNFTGTLGSGAYLAIDNGTDTGKISSQGLLAATEARIDNIIAGDAPSAAEVTDARYGADGVTYSSLGTAIRTQFTDVKSDLNDIAKSEDLSWLSYEHNGKYLNNSNVETSNALLSYTDYIQIPDDAIAVECGNRTVSGGNSFKISPNILFYDENKTLLYFSNSNDYIARYPLVRKAKYIRVNQPAKGNAGDSLIRFVFNNNSGYMGKFTVAFPSTASSRNTPIYLKASIPYTIICNTDIQGKINAFVGADTTHLVRIFSKGAVEFTPSIDGYLYLFNANGDVTGNVEVEVYESSKGLAKMRKTPTIYEVGSDKTYSSLTALLYALKGDDSEKIIYVDGGDYDIFQEYSDLGLLDGDAPSNPQTAYFDYNVWIPSNTHIIGRGIVRLLWQPSSSDISTGWSKTISPVNAAGSMILENVEIHCKNGRYCIHDDPLGKAQFVGARKIYKNVKCYKYNNDEGYGFASVIGFGIDRKMQYEFDNCYFYSEANNTTFYMHNRASDELGAIAKTNSSNVVVKNSIIATVGNGIGVKLGNVNSSSALRIRVNFDSCYIGGWLLISDESDNATGNNANTFDVTLCRCNEARVLVRDTNNQYPVKQY